jgi:H(+)-translocating pyrophosphatase
MMSKLALLLLSIGMMMMSTVALEKTTECTNFESPTYNGALDFDNHAETPHHAWVVAVPFAAGALGLIVVVVLTYQVLKEPRGTEKMQFISEKIHEGAKAFLHKEYFYLAIFVTVMFIALFFILLEENNQSSLYTGLSFLLGATLSASAGYFGMFIATKANVATTQACTKSMNDGLRVAFKSGSVMGLTVVSFGLFGLSALYIIFTIDHSAEEAWKFISGFGFGASAIALFARVGGGVYTKAADVGADLVGKVEAGIPEDHPSNPAVIADNVGDNVGDVAGMGADLFESYCGSIIATATIGYSAFNACTDDTATRAIIASPIASVALPFWIAGFGLICSIIGSFLIRTSVDETKLDAGEVLESLLGTIRTGIFTASFLALGTNCLACYLCFGNQTITWKIYGCTVIGLVTGNIIGAFTEYCTSYSFQPTKGIAEKSSTGPATVIIQGLGVGLISTSVPLIFLVITIVSCNFLAGQYGIAISAVSMLSCLGITLATDAYGPVADNAGGIAEMAGDDVDEDTRNKTDALDALGNTTAATGKGFAIGSAALTSVALITAFVDAVPGLATAGVNIEDPIVLSGVLLGGMLPFIFAALTMLSVGKAAEAIIFEVRRQFQKWPKLKDETWTPPPGVPEYDTCVAISTQAALIEMVVPGALAVFVPPAIGFLLGAQALVGVLVGALASGTLLAITMANAGGAWDNAKKYCEKGGLGEGKGKGTIFHDATVVGDTVGDPFKDTSGPALNILIKMMSLIALVLAPKFEMQLKSDLPDTWYAGVIILIVITVGVYFFNDWTSSKYEVINKSINSGSNDAEAAAPVVAASEVELTEKTNKAEVAAV